MRPSCCALTLLSSAISAFALVLPSALADHPFPKAFDVKSLRPSLGPGEGYLNFISGAEFTGHTDDNETPGYGGRDWSDNWFTVRNIDVTSENGTPSGNTGAKIALDHDMARKIWAQAGLSIRLESPGAVSTSSANPPYSNEIFQSEISALGRSPNADTINNYYLTSYTASLQVGLTALALDNVTYATSVSAGREIATLSHELGHMLLNGPAIHMQGADANHSTDTKNLLHPNNAFLAAAIDQVGKASLPRLSLLEPSQIGAVHSNPGANNPNFIKHSQNIATHGDIADFDWVSDHQEIESITGGSNGADLADGTDFMIWEINSGAVAPSGHSGPGGDPHSHGAGSLNFQGYGGTHFLMVDVFSNINRYGDTFAQQGSSQAPNAERARALDYGTPEFSADGSLWIPGKLINVFEPGWTTAAISDNYVARFQSFIPAKWVRIKSLALDQAGHDGTAQIDAVMAAGAVVKSVAALHFDVEEALIGDPQTDVIRFAARLPGESLSNGSRTRMAITDAMNLSGPSPTSISISAAAVDSGGDTGFGDSAQIDFSFVPTLQTPTAPDRIGIALEFNLLSIASEYGNLVQRFDGSFFDVRKGRDGEFFEILFNVDGLADDLQHFSMFGLIDAAVFRFAEIDAIAFEELPGEAPSILSLVIELEALAGATAAGLPSQMFESSGEPLFHVGLGEPKPFPSLRRLRASRLCCLPGGGDDSLFYLYYEDRYALLSYCTDESEDPAKVNARFGANRVKRPVSVLATAAPLH